MLVVEYSALKCVVDTFLSHMKVEVQGETGVVDIS
jgi:hypothetical protein